MSLAHLAALVLAPAACEEPARPPTPSPTVFPAVAAPAPILECSFEPVSAPGAEAESGFQMCFTPAAGSLRTASVEAKGPPTADRATADLGAAAPAPTEDVVAPCPPEMILVEGEYCPDVRHTCSKYIDEGAGFLSRHRCLVFARDPTCVKPREHRRFCMDRDEYVAPGDELPLVNQSWTMAVDTCKSLGKRLCFGSEFELACEGEELRPYPYGFERDARRCNHDLANLERRGKLRDLRVPPGARPECTSSYGVRNLVGNVDEWVHRDGFVRPWRSALRGGWWLAGRNNCRAQTTAHDEYYFGPQTGFRCCANPAG